MHESFAPAFALLSGGSFARIMIVRPGREEWLSHSGVSWSRWAGKRRTKNAICEEVNGINAHTRNSNCLDLPHVIDLHLCKETVVVYYIYCILTFYNDYRWVIGSREDFLRANRESLALTISWII